MVFAPIEKKLRDIKEVFISPDGSLNLFPFEVLQGQDGRFLIEKYTFNYLPSGRDVLRFERIEDRQQKSILIGDPDFDLTLDDKNSKTKQRGFNIYNVKGHKYPSFLISELHFTQLPETKDEVKSIQKILGKNDADLYLGKDALEEVLMSSRGPKYLHLATHGFFLKDVDYSDLIDKNIVRRITISPKPELKKVQIGNPLFRSGIALAGANIVLKSENLEHNTGIVTADKILGLNLYGTDMVVLSACDTGLGEIKSGEGVFGLRRAFTQAGAKSLVMSMWSVPDKETKELMIEFYKNLQSDKMNRCQALRQAALKEMVIVKERYGNTNPFYWGAFVFLGEP